MDRYQKYLKSIVLIGRVVFILSLIVFFMPFVLSWLVLGIQPQWGAITKAAGTWFFMNLIFWVVEPLSFFPVIGIPGSFIGGLAGNVSNMRIPCAIAAQKATQTDPGTTKGQIISTIAICISIFVNIIILAIGVLLGQAVLAQLPASVTSSLNFLLPALYGCVFAQFIGDNKLGAGVAVVLSLAALLSYQAGMLSWMGGLADAMPMVVPVFGSLAFMLAIGHKKNHTVEHKEE